MLAGRLQGHAVNGWGRGPCGALALGVLVGVGTVFIVAVLYGVGWRWL